MRRTAVFVVFLVVTSFSLPSEAEWGSHGGLDATLTTGISIGTDGRSGGIPVMFRFSHERVFIGIETNFIIPYGFGTNLLMYVYNGPLIGVHIIDPGIFYSWDDDLEISAPHMPRAFDITVGAGVEVHITGWLAVTLDWRVYLPNPFRVIPDYADFGLRSFGESLKGGQLCFGAQFSLY